MTGGAKLRNGGHLPPPSSNVRKALFHNLSHRLYLLPSNILICVLYVEVPASGSLEHCVG